MKYVEQIKIKRIYDNGDLHAEDYADAIKFKAKKRMFKAIKKLLMDLKIQWLNDTNTMIENMSWLAEINKTNMRDSFRDCS